MAVKILDIEEGKTAKIINIQGGCGVQNQLRSIGLLEGKEIIVVTHNPFKGPVVLSVNGKMISLGRGIASRIMVELTG